MRCWLTAREAAELLSRLLPGHELEAYEAMTCAQHHLNFQFAFRKVPHELVWADDFKRFEIREKARVA